MITTLKLFVGVVEHLFGGNMHLSSTTNSRHWIRIKLPPEMNFLRRVRSSRMSTSSQRGRKRKEARFKEFIQQILGIYWRRSNQIASTPRGRSAQVRHRCTTVGHSWIERLLPDFLNHCPHELSVSSRNEININRVRLPPHTSKISQKQN